MYVLKLSSHRLSYRRNYSANFIMTCKFTIFHTTGRSNELYVRCYLDLSEFRPHLTLALIFKLKLSFHLRPISQLVF
jgi:hypothetical protein